MTAPLIRANEGEVERLRAENARLREALTPSAETKAAYHGEFQFNVEYADEDGASYWSPHLVPWDQVKEIMAAICTRAALSTPAQSGEDHISDAPKMVSPDTSEVGAVDVRVAEAWCKHIQRFSYEREGVGLDASPHILAMETLKLIAAVRASPPPVEAGMVMVPVEPTREMWAAGGNAVLGYRNRHHDKVVEDIWSAMLSAAPKGEGR